MVAEQAVLADVLSEPGMAQAQDELEPAVAAIDMADGESAGHEEARQAQAKWSDREEIMVAAEMDRLFVAVDHQRDAEAAAEIFLETGWPGESLAAVDDLREA